ncbi:hypothetical protein LBBP_04503 (plasmid) [Leptospira borgpetersenii serovar Ballum]|uniref:Uncharacterized protein n=1 Tax=Leptospira borgpetersenii serovar Ballum TaxID=280505 RepID=A0A0S2IM12_LEPBO|nr:hypothetical protein LBBP_00342 [Leptospira borgpetersenii serovar Ballum]ALO28600.1 hypothetical protein LBBP_04503 [Leptospira borgpetersenii serovar Ballum]
MHKLKKTIFYEKYFKKDKFRTLLKRHILKIFSIPRFFKNKNIKLLKYSVCPSEPL